MVFFRGVRRLNELQGQVKVPPGGDCWPLSTPGHGYGQDPQDCGNHLERKH